jgi:hypothetical protein
MDGAARQVVSSPDAGVWRWAAGRAYGLDAGLHTLELGGHEPGARADRILLTDDPGFTPTEQPGSDTTPPQSVTAFTATPAHTQNTLNWTNPSSTDYVRTVVRYRTDGQYPVSPLDGFAVIEKTAAPGSADSHVHTGLTDGVTYYYSAFAIDGAGNVAEPARTEGTPWDSRPPDPPSNLTAN